MLPPSSQAWICSLQDDADTLLAGGELFASPLLRPAQVFSFLWEDSSCITLVAKEGRDDASVHDLQY